MIYRTRRRTIIYRERIERIRDRTSFSFTKSRVGGRWYWIRVILLAMGIAALTWYYRQGVNNPFADSLTVTVESAADGGGGYDVTCAKVSRNGARAVVGELRARAHEERFRPTGDSRVAFADVYPFSDSVRATLLTYANMDILACDESVYAPRAAGVRSRFWERLELLIIPPSGVDEILRVRDHFRARHTIVTAPCPITPPPNVWCADGGAFKYVFEIRNGKLHFIE